jgi:biotin carboxyl carrier protein
MKMEHAVAATAAGVVSAIERAVGDQVGQGDVVVRIGADGEEAAA